MPLVGALSGEPIDEACFICGLPFAGNGELIARLMDLDGQEWCAHLCCVETAEDVDVSTLDRSERSRLQKITPKAEERAESFRKKVN